MTCQLQSDPQCQPFLRDSLNTWNLWVPGPAPACTLSHSPGTPQHLLEASLPLGCCRSRTTRPATKCPVHVYASWYFPSTGWQSRGLGTEAESTHLIWYSTVFVHSFDRDHVCLKLRGADDKDPQQHRCLQATMFGKLCAMNWGDSTNNVGVLWALEPEARRSPLLRTVQESRLHDPVWWTVQGKRGLLSQWIPSKCTATCLKKFQRNVFTGTCKHINFALENNSI